MTEEITENGVVDTTLYSSVTVNVSGSGGSSGTDVVFYDYDGTVVTSYSAADFANLSAMPANPTHTGLTAQGWNWSLADAKTYVASYGKLNIGQMYVTDDGKTRLYFIATKSSLSVDLFLELGSDTELDVDWGDGSAHTTWTSGTVSQNHSYTSAGKYVITIEVITGEFSFLTLYNIYKAEIGNNATKLGISTFYECYALTSVTIPDDITSIEDGAFSYCYALPSVTIPDGVTGIGEDAFSECYALSSVTIPNSVTSIGPRAFVYDSALSSITIPVGVTSIGDYTLKRNRITSPSCTTYSLPSTRIWPFSRAAA